MRISDWSSDVCSSDLTKIGTGKHGFRFRKLREFVHHEADGFRPHCATTLVFLPRAIGEEVSAKHFIEKRGDVGEGRSEERRVGKECVSTCRSRWWPYN